MSYVAAIDHLYALGQELATSTPGEPPRKFDLAHMRVLAAALGDPQLDFPSVLIAGTNGKGSTAATLASILATAGYRTGLYTSPHLIRVNERIQISQSTHPAEDASTEEPKSSGYNRLHAIADEDFARLYWRVDRQAQQLVAEEDLPHHPSFFEILTAVAFLYFAEQKIEIAVLEVGLGGRLDATNIVDPILSVITDISLDHQAYLGSTISAITREKAGILRSNGTLITLPQHPEANQVLGEIAATMPSLRAVSAADYVPRPAPPDPLQHVSEPPAVANRYDISFLGERLHVHSPLVGQHQQRNIALALSAAAELCTRHGYKLSVPEIEAGIRDTRWPGRLELLTPNLLLDVAHNPAGAWSLRSYIASLPETQPRTLIFSCLRDKDLSQMAQILFPLFDSTSTDLNRRNDHIILAPIDSPRASTLEQLIAVAHTLQIPAHAAPHSHAALAQARQVTPQGGLIFATGSVYLVGEISSLVQQEHQA